MDRTVIQALRNLQAGLTTLQSRYRKVAQAGGEANNIIKKLTPYLQKLGKFNG